MAELGHDRVHELLFEYLDGQVSEVQRTAIDAHVKACFACQVELALCKLSSQAFATLRRRPLSDDFLVDLDVRLSRFTGEAPAGPSEQASVATPVPHGDTTLGTSEDAGTEPAADGPVPEPTDEGVAALLEPPAAEPLSLPSHGPSQPEPSVALPRIRCLPCLLILAVIVLVPVGVIAWLYMRTPPPDLLLTAVLEQVRILRNGERLRTDHAFSIGKGDRVETSADSYAVFAGRGGTLRLGPDTRVQVLDISKRIDFDLPVGRAWVTDQGKLHIAFRTPHALVLSDGATLDVSVTEEATTIRTFQGRVEVHPVKGPSDRVRPGYRSVATAAGLGEEQKIRPEERLQPWVTWNLGMAVGLPVVGEPLRQAGLEPPASVSPSPSPARP